MTNLYDMIVSLETSSNPHLRICVLTILDGEICVNEQVFEGPDAAQLMFRAISEWYKWSRMYDDNAPYVPETINKAGFRQLSFLKSPTEP